MNLDAAVAHWRQTDPVLADLAQHTEVPERMRPGGEPFPVLVRAIVGQQVSIAAAQTIYDRVAAVVGPDPVRILEADEATLRGCGLSGAKTASIRDLAEHVLDGRLDFAALDAMSDDEAVAALTRVRGIGPWSAKMHLMFQMGRPDICPWEDLGIRLAVARFYGVPESEAQSWLRRHHVQWSPYNSHAARVLWAARRD